MSLARDEVALRFAAALAGKAGYLSPNLHADGYRHADAFLAERDRQHPPAPVPAATVPTPAPAKPTHVRLLVDVPNAPEIIAKFGRPACAIPKGSVRPVAFWRERDGVCGIADDFGMIHTIPDAWWLPVDAAQQPTPALEPRRTVGAVVKDVAGFPFIVVADKRIRDLAGDANGVVLGLYDSDMFSRWATRAECARHGVPFVDRTTPAAAQDAAQDATQDAGLTEAEREELAKLIRDERMGVGTVPWSEIGSTTRADWLRAADAAAAWFARRGGAK